ncbi:MAG: tRNA threonylcarbamoyladenosine dehydratase [Lachnospiraceae bacterium]|nr:tRNA threonylcarbamoyladenosine dehydratase [Lachnospiraceae bacterium]
MEYPFTRTEILLGKDAMKRLARARIILFGVGGVGGHVVEALVRSGVGSLLLVDHDRISLTNLNRQIIATHSTLGKYKVDVMKKRAMDINPKAEIKVRHCFFLPGNQDSFHFSEYTYVVDAVDTVTAKLAIIEKAKKAGVPVISSMGTGNKLDPTKFQVVDISETSVCPLAKVMRRELKKRNIRNVKVLYSQEEPVKFVAKKLEVPNGEKTVVGSTAFGPSVAGLIIAGEIIREIAGLSLSSW